MGVVNIGTDGKRIDWNAIYSEYIGGGISQRKLAEKHGISVDILLKKANRDHWAKDRVKASNKAAIKAQQKAADAAADNATLAADIKKRLLMRLKRIEEKDPMDATEAREKAGNGMAIYRIRDLTGAYKDLTDGMTLTQAEGNDLLASLIALERRRADD